MSQPITLFPSYKQRENQISNYCGMVLRMVHDESPGAFQSLLENLCAGDFEVQVGPIFEQQVRRSRSIPDIAIRQKQFEIFVETKRGSGFGQEQIKNHIDSIAPSKETAKNSTVVLLLLGDFESDDPSAEFENDNLYAQKRNVSLVVITFQQLIDVIREVLPSADKMEFIADFQDYLNRENVLPKWKYLLDVVNCVNSMQEVERGFYACPNTGGNYSHVRARFFGPYKNKVVNQIREIRAVVEVSKGLADEDLSPKWINSNESKSDIRDAVRSLIKEDPHRQAELQSVPILFFLLGEPHSTLFIKGSPDGALWSKKYFWGIAEGIESAAALAQKLNGKKMEDF